MQSGSESFTMQRTFIGVVEDRNDPLQLGRVKVRAYSIHTEDKTQTTLKNWAKFEEKHPNTFACMYQFWVSKKEN